MFFTFSGCERTLQGPAGWQDSSVLQKQVQGLHREDPEGEGQRGHRQRGHPPQQGRHRQAQDGQGSQEHP